MFKLARTWPLLAATALSACSLAPDFKLPEFSLPSAFKEEAKSQPVDTAPQSAVKPIDSNWKVARSLEGEDRGQWWKIFDDETLNALQAQAAESNQTARAAAARVEEARAIAASNSPPFFPSLGIGANAVRAKPASASLAAFGGAAGAELKPYTLYSATGVASYEVDLFGRVRDTWRALSFDADATEANYRSTLLALQADVAQTYFSLRAMDAELALLEQAIAVRQEADRIMQRRADLGDVSDQELARTQSELASTRADFIALTRARAGMEHALAVLLGKLPSEFTLASAPLVAVPPRIPPGLPSSLLERRPDIAAAQKQMEAANMRIGVARTAFFPSLELTATGGFESTVLSNLFDWSSRTWALGQLAGSALAVPIFDSGHNFDRLDAAHAAYAQAVANYRQQVLVAFRDVEDSLVDQRLLDDQSREQARAAASAARVFDLTQKRYDAGDASYFEVVDSQRNALAQGRADIQVRNARLGATISLIRALGGGWEHTAEAPPPETPEPAPPMDRPAAAESAAPAADAAQ